MRCEIKKEELVSFLFKELEDDRFKEIKMHLNSCKDCQNELNEIQQTLNVLKSWKDEEPKFNFVFVEQNTSTVASIWSKLITPLKLKPVSFGVPVFAVICMLVLSIFNFNLQYHEGSLSASFGLLPKIEDNISQEAVAKMLTQFQQDNYETMSRMIQSSEYRQNQNFELAMNAWAADYEQKRVNDLRIVNTSFGILQKATQDQYVQTHEVLKDLIQQASTGSK